MPDKASGQCTAIITGAPMLYLIYVFIIFNHEEDPIGEPLSSMPRRVVPVAYGYRDNYRSGVGYLPIKGAWAR